MTSDLFYLKVPPHNLQLFWSIGLWKEVCSQNVFQCKNPTFLLWKHPIHMDYYLNKLNIHYTSIIPHRLKLFGRFDFKRISLFFLYIFLWNNWCQLWLFHIPLDYDFNKFESVALDRKNSDGRPESNLPNNKYAFMQVAFFGQNGFWEEE